MRFHDFLDLEYPLKVVTIEPVLDFDLETFVDWMTSLRKQGTLEYVWFGYDSKNCGLTEPSAEKAQRLVDTLQGHGVEVRGKTLRGVFHPLSMESPVSVSSFIPAPPGASLAPFGYHVCYTHR